MARLHIDHTTSQMNYQAFGLNTHPAQNSETIDTQANQEIIDLSLGEPLLSHFPTESLTEIAKIDGLQRYYPSLGSLKLRSLIQKNFYHNLSTENIVITHGAIGALDVVMRAFAAPNAEILIPDPGFPPYEKLAQLSGYHVKRYEIQMRQRTMPSPPSERSMICWQELDSLVNQNTKIILFNSPHNPSGMIFTELDFKLFKQFLRRHPHVYFIMDEVYRELIFDGRHHFDFSDFLNRGFIIGSFSKMFPLQGARIGWIAGLDYQLEKLNPYFFNAYGAISSFGQELAYDLLQKNLQYLSLYQNARDVIVQKLSQEHMSYILPQAGFFVLIDVGENELSFIQELRQNGLIVTSGSLFGRQGVGYIRLCFAHEIEKLEQAMDIIVSSWRKQSIVSLEQRMIDARP